jgi:hypothetical protein
MMLLGSADNHRSLNKFVIHNKLALHNITTRGKKGKAVPLTGCEGPQGCETSRFPHFLDNRLTDGCQPYKLAALYPPGGFLVLISVRG